MSEAEKLYSGCIEDALVSRLANSDATYDNLTSSFRVHFRINIRMKAFIILMLQKRYLFPEKVSERNIAYISTKERNYSKAELEIFWKQCRSIVKKEKLCQ